MTYIIWSPEGKAPPKVTFSNRHTADSVARKMAKQHIGQTFHVLKIKSTAKVTIPEPDVQYYGRWKPYGSRKSDQDHSEAVDFPQTGVLRDRYGNSWVHKGSKWVRT